YALALDGELRRYQYEFSGKRFVKYCESIAEYKPPRYFRGPRIILRELISRQFRLQAVLVNEDFITNKSHQSILLENDNYSLGYILGILNSRLLSHYH
ncbi:MAG: TaqI-like C-terminal specificity domain-containing protein, partial [Planctomycetota bacterium]